MSDIDAIVGADFIRHIEAGMPDALHESYDSFTDKLIKFIHMPIEWAEKHHVLVRLKARFSIHLEKRKECAVSSTYLACALSLIEHMRHLLFEVQKRCADALHSHRSAFTLANGEAIKWTDSDTDFNEFILALHAKGCFNKGNAEISDLFNFFTHCLSIKKDVETCYESGRQMKRRKGRAGAQKYDEKHNIESRSYWVDDMRRAINERWVRQDRAGDGRCIS